VDLAFRERNVMKKKTEGTRHSLASGIPCVKHRCVKCCLKTRMLLSSLDLERILKLGYRLKHFTVKTNEGWRLKNNSGRCAFLQEEGCEIYPHRPEGCKLYSLVYDENLMKAAIDSICPYSNESKASLVNLTINSFLSNFTTI